MQEEEKQVIAKILCLQKQQKRLKIKAIDILEQGLETIDKLKEAKEREQLKV